MRSLTLTNEYTVLTCCHVGCGIEIVMPASFYEQRQRDAELFWCLNGHNQRFTTTEVTRLRSQLDQAEADARWQTRRREQLQRDLDYSRRQVAARKGQVTKMRNRIANGICPVPGCKRSGFDNVAAHIATVHPDFHAHEPDQ